MQYQHLNFVLELVEKLSLSRNSPACRLLGWRNVQHLSPTSQQVFLPWLSSESPEGSSGRKPRLRPGTSAFADRRLVAGQRHCVVHQVAHRLVLRVPHQQGNRVRLGPKFALQEVLGQ